MRARTVAAVASAMMVAPQVALACPQCAGRSDGGVVQGVLLTLFVLFPFVIVGAVVRFIRSEP